MGFARVRPDCFLHHGNSSAAKVRFNVGEIRLRWFVPSPIIGTAFPYRRLA